MKIPELIKQLQELKEIHGHCDVAIEDADTGWHLNIKIVQWDKLMDRVLISGEYGDELPS